MTRGIFADRDHKGQPDLTMDMAKPFALAAR
jgi:hypothetical protein